VVEAIDSADAVVIAPSNPVLSVWPILAIPGIRAAVQRVGRVLAISPLIGGRALKGPAAEAMLGVGLTNDLEGVLAAYGGLVTHLVIDTDEPTEPAAKVEVLRTNTMIADPNAAATLAEEIRRWLS
jgi:LPPG:FO 2-phospho-L-lactate transferase